MYMAGDRPWFDFWPDGVPRHIDYPEIPLLELLSGTAKKYHDNTAFICREDSLTYAKLDMAASKLATCAVPEHLRQGF